ncbi:MAG: hypothetical protein Q8L04_11210 [Ignavibacteria bacterium]|nr:hypothetical protein [Ignavibacteria bacterium]
MRFLFFIFLSLSSVLAQQVSIKEVLDANLFKLSDGRIVKLAGVDAPQKSISYEFLKEISQETIDFSKSYFQNQKFMVTVLTQCQDYQLVLLFKEYPLETVLINSRFLERGLGKYIPNNNDVDSKRMVRGENYAIQNNIGIWKYYQKNERDTFDCELSNQGLARIADTTLFKRETENPIITEPSIPLQFLCGAGLAVVSVIPVGCVGYLVEISLSGNTGEFRGLGGAILGGFAGYFIGFTTGIYLHAKRSYPKIDYAEFLGMTFGLSLLSTVATALIVNDKRSGIPYWVALLSPVVFSLGIANTFYIPPKIEQPTNTSFISSFKDFRESQTTRLELFRINF